MAVLSRCERADRPSHAECSRGRPHLVPLISPPAEASVLAFGDIGSDIGSDDGSEGQMPHEGLAESGDVRPAQGLLANSVSNAVVRLFAEYLGRGPTKARTVVSRDLISVVLEDTLTKAERSLIERGQQD